MFVSLLMTSMFEASAAMCAARCPCRFMVGGRALRRFHAIFHSATLDQLIRVPGVVITTR
ncbi:hypothetical protein C5615_29810 [Burkholderia cepacia]|uniref:Secreted protein n=1 Tax=Burkholderia cepacia TaxID=292 RepID=A0A2S8IEC0_BURCE|nr:hypothetical protein C5615_29810 [Burkholderia cepacia]